MARLQPVPVEPVQRDERDEHPCAVVEYARAVDFEHQASEPGPLVRVARQAVARVAEMPAPVVAVGGAMAGVAVVSGAKAVRRARAARSFKHRAHGPLIAIVSDRIQVDLRPRRR